MFDEFVYTQQNNIHPTTLSRLSAFRQFHQIRAYIDRFIITSRRVPNECGDAMLATKVNGRKSESVSTHTPSSPRCEPLVYSLLL